MNPDRPTAPLRSDTTSLVEYRITEQDYVRAQRLFARMTPRGWTALAILAAGAILLAVLGRADIRPFAVGGLIGIAVLLAMPHTLLPWNARRQYRKYKGIQSPVGIELREDGVRFVSSHGEGVLIWNHVLKWRQDADYVLLYPMPRMFHIVPRSVAAQGLDIDGLISRLEARVGKAS